MGESCYCVGCGCKTNCKCQCKKCDPYKKPETLPFDTKVGDCEKCGLELHKVMGYCCPHIDCPTGLGPTIC